MSDVSYATARKIRILTEKVGADWKEKYPNRSIDAVYNEVVGDLRKNLFCKITPEAKKQVEELVENYDMKMAQLIEHLINSEHQRWQERTGNYSKDLANEYSENQ